MGEMSGKIDGGGWEERGRFGALHVSDCLLFTQNVMSNLVSFWYKIGESYVKIFFSWLYN